MSLNWVEINLILTELDLNGLFIEKITQPSYDLVCWRLYGRGRRVNLLLALTPGACRLHATNIELPKAPKPLRFNQFLNARIRGGRIKEAIQLGTDRIVRFTVQRGLETYRLFLRLWSNAANLVLVNDAGIVLDAMRRLPKRGEVSGQLYPLALTTPSEPLNETTTYQLRELPGDGSFNERVDAWYRERAGSLSLESLRQRVSRLFDGRTTRLAVAIEQLDQKRQDYRSAEGLKEAGDLILANLSQLSPGAEWLETTAWPRADTIRIKLNPRLTPQANAQHYYEQFRKAKNGLSEIETEIAESQAALQALTAERRRLLSEDNPLKLARFLSSGRPQKRPGDKARPGLCFHHNGWTFLVGRNAAENDELLRHHTRGSDWWVHCRDFPGAYVFIKAKPGKSIPLDSLLDAANLALFYSKGRQSGQADLYYTQVKYLRRPKDGPKALVLATQEKNLRINLDPVRLKALEAGKE